MPDDDAVQNALAKPIDVNAHQEIPAHVVEEMRRVGTSTEGIAFDWPEDEPADGEIQIPKPRPDFAQRIVLMRDDSNVFEHSRSALIVRIIDTGGLASGEGGLELAAGHVQFAGARAQLEAELDHEGAQELHRRLGELLAEWPE